MNTALSVSRANSRPSKDKNVKAQQQTNSIKTEGPPTKVQATPEQIRLAQMISESPHGSDADFERTINQVMDVTGKSRDVVEIALHDCQNDADRAVNMLLEGNGDQGEWRATGKKKKAPKATEKKTDSISNHIDGKTDKQEETSDRERPDRERPESTTRKNRRMDSRPPRLANRGRGRERNERSDRSDNFRSDSFRGNRGDNSEYDKAENGFGTFNYRDDEFDGGRGRGRGRGRGGGRGRGRGRSFQKNSRFDKGPQIDTWTNETAANAEKENTIGSWGDNIEDWNDDTWTGSLTETKVFTASSVQGPPSNEVPMADSALGQRLDLGALLQQKPATNDNDQSYQTAESSYITQYNQQATETIKNTIGIGSGPRASSLASQLVTSALTNHLPTTSMTMNSSQLSSSLVDQLAASSQLSSSPQSTAAVDALVSSLRDSQNSGSLDNVDALSGPHVSNALPGQQNAFSESNQQSVLQQRPKAQRTKLPPPSKIPASAVEMPGHIMTTLDVQFGNWEYGADTSAFSFGSGGDSQVSSSHTSSVSNSAVSSMSNHLPQPTKPSESVITSSIMTAPQNNSTSVMSGQDQNQSPRNNMYHNSPYTTPTKKEPSSLTPNKLSPPEPIPFPPSQSDRKSSPLMVSQRTGNTSNSLQQASLSSGQQDTNNMKSAYSQTTQNYQSSSYPSQKSGLSSTTGLTNASGLSNSTGLSNSSVLSNSSGLSNSGGLSNTTGLSNSAGLSNAGVLSNTTGLSNSQGLLSNTTGLSNSAGLSNTTGLSNSAGLNNSAGLSNSGNLSNAGSLSNAAAAVLSNAAGLSNTAGMSNTTGLSNTAGLSNTSTLSSSSGLSNASVFSHASSQPGSYPNQYQTGSNQYQSSQNQYQTGQNQYQTGQSQYHSSQNQYQNYGQSGGAFQNQTSSFTGNSGYSNSNQPSQGSLYPTSVSNAYQTTPSAMYHQGSSVQTQSNPSYLSNRDTQSAPAYQTSVSQSSSYQRDSQSGLSAPVSQSPSAYTGQTYGTSQHQNNLQSNLQTSPMSASKISETLSKMKVQDPTTIDTRQSPSQYESSTSTTTASMTTTTSTASLATGTTTSPAVSSTIPMTTAANSTRITATTTTSSSKSTKAPPNLPPGVQLLGHQYIMGQGTLPPFYGLQQPLYANYEAELLLQQQRLPPLANYNYDMTFGVPTTLTSGREQTTIANVQYSGAENKMGRVEAQSPIPTTQQTTQSAAHQQHFINTIPYGYYYPQLGIPGAAAAAAAAAGFQYPATMFPMPPVTNTAHIGTTANTQFPKTYGSHAYGANKAYEDLTQGTDFGKTTYVNQSQKVSAGTGTVSSVTGSGDIPGTGYGKSHTQPFEKQGFHHAGTPPPFNLPMATGTQGGPLGAPTTPYGAPFVPMMTHQPPSQILHPQLQQDSSSISSRSHIHSQQNTTQAKASAPKPYANTYWGSN